MIVAILAADLWVLRGLDEATPVSTAEAVQRYREHAAGAAPSTASSASRISVGADPRADDRGNNSAQRMPATTTVQAPPAGGVDRQLARPEPGVYAYDTEGFETFGSSRHEYPATTNAVVTASDGDCAWTFDHLVLEEHRDTYTMCTRSDDVELVSWRFYRRFMGFALDELYRCADASLRQVHAEAPQNTSFRCRADDEDAVTMTITSTEKTSLSIGGESVPAVHLDIVGEITGGPTGRFHIELWMHDRNGLRLRERRVVDADVDAAAITGRYHEEAEFTVRSLSPRT